MGGGGGGGPSTGLDCEPQAENKKNSYKKYIFTISRMLKLLQIPLTMRLCDIDQPISFGVKKPKLHRGFYSYQF